MLQTTSGYDWAQIGWADHAFGGLGRKLFLQWTYNGTFPTHYYSPKSVGSYTDYRVEYTGSLLKFYADDEWYVQTNTVDFTPNQATISGEINNARSQMAGGYGNGQTQDQAHERMYSAYWKKDSSTWLAFLGTGFITSGWSGYFGQQIYNFWDIHIWDKSCQN